MKQPGGLSYDRTKNNITFEFPESGVLDIQGDAPTLDWHHVTARYQNGKLIPVVQPDRVISADEIALRPAGLLGNKEDWYVVGTYDDLKHAMEEKRGFKFPPEP